MFRYALLHPRGDNTEILAGDVLGIEVTIPAFAAKCGLGNIDPQHLGGDASRAAIEEALTWPVPAEGSTLVTVRADADSVGSMAVLLLRAGGYRLAQGALDKVALIAEADKEASGPWPGVRPAPSPEDLVGPATPVMHLAADHARPLAERVELFAAWLSGDDTVQSVLDRYEDIALGEAREALANLNVTVHGPIAVVVGSHRLAMSIGYRHAPMVIATNPAFSFTGGTPHRKHTVARWNTDALPAFLDWPGMTEALTNADPAATHESGWGGSTSIIGSPQGTASGLATPQVVEIVSGFLADGIQQMAWDLGDYADYYAALQELGQPYDVEDAASVSAAQRDVAAAMASLAQARRPETAICPRCSAFHGQDVGQRQEDGSYRCIRGHTFSAV